MFSILGPLAGSRVPRGRGNPRAAEDPFGWRKDRGMVAVCSRLTWVLVGVYAIRLLIMVPLYLAAEVAWARRREDRPRLAAVGGLDRDHGFRGRAHPAGA